MIWALLGTGSLQVALVDLETPAHCGQQLADRHLVDRNLTDLKKNQWLPLPVLDTLQKMIKKISWLVDIPWYSYV